MLCDTPQYDPTSASPVRADRLTSPDLTARATGSRNLIELDGEKVRHPGLGSGQGGRAERAVRRHETLTHTCKRQEHSGWQCGLLSLVESLI